MTESERSETTYAATLDCHHFRILIEWLDMCMNIEEGNQPELCVALADQLRAESQTLSLRKEELCFALKER